MKNKHCRDELLAKISHYFDEIYIYIPDVITESNNELVYGTVFMKWNKPSNCSKPFKDEKMNERLWEARKHVDTCFNVYFEEIEDGYKKYLFINKNEIMDFVITVDNIITIMRSYCIANILVCCAAFDQKKIRNEFIAILVSLFPDSIAKLYKGILSISMSENEARSVSIEDGESFNQVDLNSMECLEMAEFFKSLSAFLL